MPKNAWYKTTVRITRAAAAALVLAGCSSPLLLIESLEPGFRGQQTARTYLLRDDGNSILFETADLAAGAVAVDPWGTAAARAKRVGDRVWMQTHNLKNGALTSSYKLPGDAGGQVELWWPQPNLIVALCGERLCLIPPGSAVREIGSARGIIISPSGRTAAVFGAGEDLTDDRRLKVYKAPKGLRPLAFHPGDRTYLALDHDGSVHMVDTKDGTAKKLVLEFPGHGTPKVVDAAYSGDGKACCLTGVLDGGMGLYRVLTTGPRAYGTMLPVGALLGRERIDIAGRAGNDFIILLDRRRILKYAPADGSVIEIFSGRGTIEAVAPFMRN
ncbi:MAG: hypothetical protein JW909_00785 [Planctomycetes bacterium]|nr:hypothetical protein [Planctomycetota bacterium]